MADLDPKTVQAQRLRFQRFLISVSLYALWALLTVFAQLMGMIHSSPIVLAALAVGVTATVVGFWWAFRSGANLALDDPSMTLAQCAIGLMWLTLLMYVVPEWRDLLLAVFLVVLTFGTFKLKQRQFIVLSLAAFAGYTIMSAADLYFGVGGESAETLLFRLAAVGCLLGWCAYFSSYVSRLRDQLFARNEQLERMVREVTHLAERDDLTQAYNRRSIIDTLGRLRESALRYGEAFSVAIVDIDFFKRVNDERGHLVGDRVLADFAGRVRAELRLLDEIEPVVDSRRLGRYGGEEFILILPRTRLDGAHACAERVRRVTAEHPFDSGIEITVSAGVAEYSYSETIDELLRRADRALYTAKAEGRNTVRHLGSDRSGDDTRTSEIISIADYQSDR